MESILGFFDICGFFTGFTTTSTSKCHWIAVAAFILHILLATLLTIHLVYRILVVYILLGIIDAINEFMHYLTLLCTYWIMLLNSYSDRHIVKSFWEEYLLVHLEGMHKRRLFILLVLECFAVKFITIAVFVHLHNMSMVMMLPYLHLSYIVQLKVFHYIFHLRILRLQLMHLVRELKDSSNWSASHGTIFRITHIRRLHNDICALIGRMNRIHSLANAAALLCQFYALLWTTNWISLYIEWSNCCSLICKLLAFFSL